MVTEVVEGDLCRRIVPPDKVGQGEMAGCTVSNFHMRLRKEAFSYTNAGGVGLFAHQLARQSGAYVVRTAGHARNDRPLVLAAG
jgi:NADPH:quinone reductase-like Zn-dependent oxidoreductase